MLKRLLQTFLAKKFWSERSLFKLRASLNLLENLPLEQMLLSPQAAVKAEREEPVEAVEEAVVVVADQLVVAVVYVQTLILFSEPTTNFLQGW
jgi:hypothetical protein